MLSVWGYTDPIITVDFASLYPSLMRSWNLSPDTLLTDHAAERVPHSSITTPDGRALKFVATSHVQGLMPRILTELLGERKRVKRAMNAETNTFKRDLLNAKQLALKISANSVYGACGATKGLIQAREVAEATTTAGRDVIGFTKKVVESTFSIPGCTVV